MKRKKQNKIHRAWAILFGCCLLQGGSLGIIHNCRGIFYTPIIEDLGFKMGAFTFYMLFFGVCSCLVMPFLGKLFAKYDLRILLGTAVLVFTGSVFAMGCFRTLPAFYIAGAFQGFSGAFLMFYPAPLILGNWFYKRTGLAIGISAAFSGLMGVVGNPLASTLIVHFGWRISYFIFGGISLLMMLPVSLFLLRLRPEDVGLRPFGAEENTSGKEKTVTEWGVPGAAAKRTASFWIMILAGLLAANTASYYSHLSPIGKSFGYAEGVSALLVSASMAGNVVSKIVLGQLYDRRGLRFTLALGTVLTGAGFGMLLVPDLHVRILGAFLCGTGMAMSAIMCAITVKDVYGLKYYNELLTFNSMAATLGTSLMTMLTGVMVDIWGRQNGYIIALVVGIVLTVLMGLCFMISIRGGRKTAAPYRE